MQHRDVWERFWRDAPTASGTVFWDVDPHLAAAIHLPLFRPHCIPVLPLVDIGCGNGTQSHFLARHHRPVVGVDIAEAAIARACAGREKGKRSATDFRQLDAADKETAQRLHAELGESNVYLRGVLHLSRPDDRRRIAEAVAMLVGVRGRAFVVEPARAGSEVLSRMMRRPHGPPQGLEGLAVLRASGLEPVEMPDESLPELFRAAGLDVWVSGTLPMATNGVRADGSRVELPSNWIIAGRR